MHILDFNDFFFLSNFFCKFPISCLYNNFIKYNFYIVFDNKILKKIGNRTPNKFIKITPKFRIYKLLIFLYFIN